MIENSYDIPGLHFCILTSTDLCGQTLNDIYSKEDQADFLNTLLKNVEPVDFSQVDGLDFKLLRVHLNEYLPKDFVIFAYYLKTTAPDGKNILITIGNKWIIEDSQCPATPIDQAIAETLILRQNDENKKIVRCFLQRYRYGSKEETDKALQYKKQ